MIITTGIFAAMVLVTVVGLIFMTFQMQKENNRFNDELQFFLRQRIIAHNRVKAQLAVLKTKYDKLESENSLLKKAKETSAEEAGFSGLLAETEFVEARNQKIEMLQNEINALKNLSVNDFA